MTLQLNLHPSRYLLAFILLSHVGAMLCLLALSLQWWAMLGIEACLVGSFIYTVQKYIMRTAPSTITKVWVDDQDKWVCLQRNKEILSVALKGDSVCSNWLVILNFEDSPDLGKRTPKKYSVLVFPDSVTKTEYRRLKAWMNSH
jgi:hypothetical protein